MRLITTTPAAIARAIAHAGKPADSVPFDLLPDGRCRVDADLLPTPERREKREAVATPFISPLPPTKREKPAPCPPSVKASPLVIERQKEKCFNCPHLYEMTETHAKCAKRCADKCRTCARCYSTFGATDRTLGCPIGEWEGLEYPADTLHVTLSARGLGDAVCGLYAACGLADSTGRPVVYHAHSAAWLARCTHPGVQVVPEGGKTPCVDGNADYDRQIRTASTRKQDYADNFAKGLGIPTFAPVVPRSIDRAVREPRAGRYVVLAPFCEYSSRDWGDANYAELARRIHATGREVVAIGASKHEDRLGKTFRGTPATWIWGQSAEFVTGLLIGAERVIGNDSGIAHVAGLLGCPTASIHAGSLPHDFLFSLAPTVKSVTPGKRIGRSDHNTPMVRQVTVEQVMPGLA